MQLAKKILPIILFYTFLSGCDVEISTNSKASEEAGMFGKGATEKYVIFSPMEGVLMQNGKPLAGATIVRTLWWNDNQEGLVEEFKTDDKGRFSLPIREEELSLNMLTQFVSSASLETTVNGQSVDIWYNNKFEKELYAETEGRLKDLICDLGSEEVVVEAGLSKIMTKCRWKDTPESQ